MATYAVGDIHGCFETLQRLLEVIRFESGRDELWFVGDFVNVGPDSRRVVQWVYDHRESCEFVLGNHDLHMIAVMEGVHERRSADTFGELVDTPKGRDLTKWMIREGDLLKVKPNWVLVHAGLHPAWNLETAVELSDELEQLLRGARRPELLEKMYGNKPTHWSPELSGIRRQRFAVNAFTRMRALDPEDGLNFSFKEPLSRMPDHLDPWFKEPPAVGERKVLFGHWSALGYHRQNGTICLDNGCCWGFPLTAMRLSDERIFQVESERPQVF